MAPSMRLSSARISARMPVITMKGSFGHYLFEHYSGAFSSLPLSLYLSVPGATVSFLPIRASNWLKNRPSIGYCER